MKLLSRVWLFVTPWTVAYQAPLSMEFSRQEYWSGLPFPSPGDLPDPGNEPGSPTLQADALPSEPPEKPLGVCLLVWLLSSVLVPLFILPFFFLFSFCECMWVYWCFCLFSFTICFRVFSVHSLFVCLCVFFPFFFLFLSLSSLCCVESWYSSQESGLKPPR